VDVWNRLQRRESYRILRHQECYLGPNLNDNGESSGVDSGPTPTSKWIPRAGVGIVPILTVSRIHMR
jgi:hypothetical protein